MKRKILVIDDEPAFVNWAEQVLIHEGYEMFTASDGHEALRLLFAHKPDLVLLDVVMPRMDGWETCSRIREISDIPIVIITGKLKDEDNIVRGLDYGADDYLIKPIGNRELAARVRAALRRAELPSTLAAPREITYSDDYLTVDISARRVTVNGERVKFTPREFRLLAVLVENTGCILSHQQILEKVWGWEYTDDLDYVRIYISHLRQKIEPVPTLPKYIISECGVGYYFQKAG